VQLVEGVCPVAAAGLGDYLDIGFLLQQPAKAGSHDRMIVDQHGRDRPCGPITASIAHALITVPMTSGIYMDRAGS
jgi:hypothetical protein